MVVAGVHIVPLMPADDVISVAVEAERLGYEYCLVADEGFHPDVYACLGVIARATDRITLGVLTNGYTRHPAVTAAAAATVNELSGGRLVVTLLAGGSMVLRPMGIERARPARVVADSVQVLKRLWSGDEVSWRARPVPSTELGSAWDPSPSPSGSRAGVRACSSWPDSKPTA